MCDKLCLQSSCLTIALKKDFCFISSFPGFLTFGFVTKNHYKRNKFFQFSHFELSKLYSAILKMIHFMADNTDNIEKSEVLTKQIDNCNVRYLIVGVSNAKEKIVKFCLEANLESFDLPLTYFELNDFLNTLTDIIIGCLCLTSIEKEMIQNIIVQPLEDLITFQNFLHAKKYLTTMYDGKSVCLSSIENMSTILVHYHFIVIIVHKLKSLVNPELFLQNIDEILQ